MKAVLRVAFDEGDALDVTVTAVAVMRLERLTGLPYPELAARGFVGTPYKLAWLALQEVKHPAVLPHVDLRLIPELILNVGAEELAAIASIETE